MRITLLTVPLCFGVAAAIIVPMCMVKRPAKPVRPAVVVVSPVDSVTIKQAQLKPKPEQKRRGGR
jgi:hypothetical protein